MPGRKLCCCRRNALVEADKNSWVTCETSGWLSGADLKHSSAIQYRDPVHLMGPLGALKRMRTQKSETNQKTTECFVAQYIIIIQ